MNHLDRLQALLPPPYSMAADSVLTGLLNIVAMEMEIFQEDLDRMRQSHWIKFVYHLEDAEKLAALLGIKRLSWEALPVFRERLLALVKARLDGALGIRDIEEFVYNYIANSEKVLSCTFIPGLQTVTMEQAFGGPPAEHPKMRMIELLENPPREKSSLTLLARGGKVPYLYRWQEKNQGLSDTIARVAVTGTQGGKTAVPIIANLTTGDMIGYMGVLKFGETLELQLHDAPDPQNPRLVSATLNGRDANASVFSVSGLTLDKPVTKDQFEAKPLLPRMARGTNDWIYLSAGFYGVKALDHFFFSIADAQLREGVFDRTFFDHSLFPSGTVAQLAMEWTETEPASFEVRVPRYVVAEPVELDDALDVPAYHQLAEGLDEAIGELHAAGIKTVVVFRPFSEVQRQKVRAQVPWVMLDPEEGPSGFEEFTLGGLFGQSKLGDSKFS